MQAKFERLHKDRPWHDGSFPEDLSKWAAQPSAKHPFHFSHGTTVWVSLEDHGEGGDFLRTGAAVADQREDEHP